MWAVDREKGMGLLEREACKLVGISTGSYYTWKRAEKKLAVAKNPLVKVISYRHSLGSTMGRIEMKLLDHVKSERSLAHKVSLLNLSMKAAEMCSSFC